MLCARSPLRSVQKSRTVQWSLLLSMSTLPNAKHCINQSNFKGRDTGTIITDLQTSCNTRFALSCIGPRKVSLRTGPDCRLHQSPCTRSQFSTFSLLRLRQVEEYRGSASSSPLASLLSQRVMPPSSSYRLPVCNTFLAKPLRSNKYLVLSSCEWCKSGGTGTINVGEKVVTIPNPAWVSTWSALSTAGLSTGEPGMITDPCDVIVNCQVENPLLVASSPGLDLRGLLIQMENYEVGNQH